MSRKMGLKTSDEKGAVAILVAIMLAAFLGIAALAVDIGYVMVGRNQLQDISDATALAGARWLGHYYCPCDPPAASCCLPYAEQQAYVCNPADIQAVVADVANKNDNTGTGSFTVNPGEIIIGTWDANTKTLTATNNAPNAVRVIVRRDASTNGPITTFFAKTFGRNTVDVSATATAALTGQSTMSPGGLPLPVGISSLWTSWSNPCGQAITFYPTGTSCAGWMTYDQKANAAELKKILNGLTAGTYQSPAVTTQETQFNFVGGTLASEFDDMQALFNAKKDPATGTWTTPIVIYQGACGNPNQSALIVGFATITITQVFTSPQNTIVGEVQCNNIDDSRGGGGNYGTLGSIPGLVQ